MVSNRFIQKLNYYPETPEVNLANSQMEKTTLVLECGDEKSETKESS